MSADNVKAAIVVRAEDFVRELFDDRAHRAGAIKWRIGAHDSLSVEVKDGALVYYSHEDGAGGDAIALWHHERGGSMADALKACAAWAGVSPMDVHAPRSLASLKIKTAPVITFTGLPYALSEAECNAARTMAHALYCDAALCQRIADGRGWQAATLCALAREMTLGWHDGKLAFLYETGVKLRWRENGGRIIRWRFGKPFLWRHWMLSISAHRRVIVAEGETDAIRLIDCGMEADGLTAVIALPSASTFAPGWASLFAGRDVILALDNDKAGRQHSARIAAMLKPHARTVASFNWEGIVDEAA